jgi:hypothetical protein
MGLSEDPMQNGQFVSKMIVAGPGLAKAGADALIANGQGDVLNNLRKAIQAHIFNGLMEADATLKTKGGYRVKVGEVKEYFNSPKNIRRTETLKAWMGEERWRRLRPSSAQWNRRLTRFPSWKPSPTRTTFRMRRCWRRAPAGWVA